MESEGKHSHPEPVDPRGAFLLYLELLERGENVPFEPFCDRFPHWREELAALHRDWRQVSRVLGKWAGDESLSSRILRRFGPKSLRDLGLEREAAPAPEEVFVELFRKLRIRREGFGRYRIKDHVGHGGMGVVLRVWDDELKRHLAMKIIRSGDGISDEAVTDTSTVGRFLDEAQVTAQLEHPGIVPVHELGLDGSGNLYFTMRLVKGRNLDEVFDLVRTGQEDWNQTRALGVLLKACEALAYAHSKGVIHRDLKPSNIMVGRFGEVYVMDWGLAKVVGVEDLALAGVDESGEREDIHSERRSAGGTPGSPLITQGGHALGTPAYMSPEQACGDVAAMGPQSDVYSMGAILYHLLTGHTPYAKHGRELEARQVLAKVVLGPPEPVQLAADRPAELVAICTKAMARRVEHRYPTVVELANDLRAYLEHRVVGAYRAGSLHALRKWVERNRALSSSFAAATVILIAGAFQYFRAEDLSVQAKEARQAKSDLDEHLEPYSDYEQSRELVAEADELWPISPEKISLLEAWLGRANDLVSRRDRHLERLAKLRVKALPWSEEDRSYDDETYASREALSDKTVLRDRLRRVVAAVEQDAPTGDVSIDAILAHDPSQKHAVLVGLKENLTATEGAIDRFSKERAERRTWRYADQRDQSWDRVIMRLTNDLGVWTVPGGLLDDASSSGTGIPRRLALAQRMKDALESSRGRAAWSEAIQSIADRNKNPTYKGLQIQPQIGLAPIGQDPDSGFWEFAHLATGEPPVRDREGKLRIGAESAVVLVLLPGGRAILGAQKEDPGSPNYDPSAAVNEGPVMEFELAPFFMSKYELTQGQWYRLTAEDPSWSSYRSAYGPYGSKLEMITECNPVEHVSWVDCERALGRIGLLLPTEAQWEYAARGGMSTQFWGGEGLDALEGAANIADAFAKQEAAFPTWIYEEDFDDGIMLHCRVDLDWPNPFGLHGVLGNVSEWCRDSPGAYDVAGMEPGTGMRIGGKERVFRGGSYMNPSYWSRSAKRGQEFPDQVRQDLGVRPARKIDA